MRPSGPALPASVAERWLAAAVPWWVPRVVLIGGWGLALAAAIVGDTAPACSAADPSICGPDQVFAWAVVVLLATPVLLWWQPLWGCVAGVAFAVLDVAVDDLAAAKIAFVAHGLACLVVAGWMVRARRRQRQVVATLGLPRWRLPSLTVADRWSSARLLACALLVVAVVGCWRCTSIVWPPRRAI